MKNLILLLLVAASFASCGPSTHIEKSWQEPGASYTPGPENKALIIALVKDEVSRRVIEDELTQRIKTSAVPSYKLLSSENLQAANDDLLNQKVAEGKFTHILVMRLADMEKETNYVPGTTRAYYGSYGSYYGYGASLYASPGYYTTDKNYFIETTIYSVTPNKLLWTGTTKTVNPTKINKTVNEIADVVVSKMKKDGFLK